MTGRIFNLFISGSGWNETSDTVLWNRILHGRSQEIKDQYISGNTISDALASAPCLFMTEACMGDSVEAKVGSLSSAIRQGRQCVINYTLHHGIPPVPLSVLEAHESILGLTGWKFGETGWYLGQGNIFDLLGATPRHSSGGWRWDEEEEPIGQGGSGCIYPAFKKVGATTINAVAKCFNPSPYHIADRDVLMQRFARELEALAGLTHHAIVPIYDAGIDHDGRSFMIMPHIEGVRLNEYRSACGDDLGRFLNAYEIVLEGVAFAHSRNVLHRDLNPQNILVRAADSHPIILDFGTAYLWDEIGVGNATITVGQLGTPGFIAPELSEDPKIRHSTLDVFSLAATLYTCLRGQNHRITEGYHPLAATFPNLAPLDHVLQVALSNNPAQRYQTVNDLWTALQQARRQVPV